MEGKYIKGNKLIAEFRFPNAIEEYNSGEIDIEDGLFQKVTLIFGQFELMKYHSSWDWLMPVIKKINSLDHLRLWDKNNIDKFNLTEYIRDVDIDMTFELVCMFIEWYNNEKK